MFSLIKAKFSTKIKAKYKDLNFTTSDRSSTKPKFPTVYIHMIDSQEVGSDLEGTSIPGVNAAFQVDVSDNQNNSRTDEVAREVLRIMKSMRFLNQCLCQCTITAGMYISPPQDTKEL